MKKHEYQGTGWHSEEELEIYINGERVEISAEDETEGSEDAEDDKARR